MDLTRRQIAIYIALAVVVVAVGVRYLITSRDAGASGSGAVALEALPAASPAGSGSPAASGSPGAAAAEIVVYVCGAVRTPGVYRFPEGARISDLIERAGGATEGAQLDAVNLAAKLADGQQIVVPKKGEVAAAPAGAAATEAGASGAASSGGSAAAPGALVNLNTATLSDLDTLPGVGPSTAQKIIDYRTASGGFKSVDELNEVSGIGEVRFAELKDLVTI